MNITVVQPLLSKVKADVLVVPAGPDTQKNLLKKNVKLTKDELSLSALNQLLSGKIGTYLSRQGYKGGAREVLSMPTHAEGMYSFITLIGMPSKGTSCLEAVDYYRKLGAIAINTAKTYKAKSVAVYCNELDLKGVDNTRALIEGAYLAAYTFDCYKSKKDDEGYKGVEELVIVSKRSPDKRGIEEGQVYAHATALARDLVNTPPNDCQPKDLVKKAKELAKSGKLEIKVFEKPELEKMGAGGLLAVSHGSDTPPYLIRMVLKPKKKSSKVVALVGKGVTFDSGGLSIKPAGSMEEMKMDMAGAAAVLGAMEALSKLSPKVEVRAYIPTTENMINGKATRPGDIAKAMSGKSIEILNTDAEGRLILADALCLAEKDKCDTIVDLATLTGACVVALGPDYAGLFANDDKLAGSLAEAAEVSGERLWRLPLAKEYKRMIESPVADIKNTGGRWGGAITGALFLQEFVTGEKTKWAHIDIAGPAFSETPGGYIKKGGVGFGVRTIVNFVRSL